MNDALSEATTRQTKVEHLEELLFFVILKLLSAATVFATLICAVAGWNLHQHRQSAFFWAEPQHVFLLTLG